jgi:hypothetical protein
MSNSVKWAGLETVKYRDLGYANSWGEPPEVVKRCQDLGHKLEGEQVYNCVVEHRCPVCKYYYRIDSSG